MNFKTDFIDFGAAISKLSMESRCTFYTFDLNGLLVAENNIRYANKCSSLYGMLDI